MPKTAHSKREEDKRHQKCLSLAHAHRLLHDFKDGGEQVPFIYLYTKVGNLTLWILVLLLHYLTFYDLILLKEYIDVVIKSDCGLLLCSFRTVGMVLNNSSINYAWPFKHITKQQT